MKEEAVTKCEVGVQYSPPQSDCQVVSEQDEMS